MLMCVCHWEGSGNADIHRGDRNASGISSEPKEFQFCSWLAPVLLIILGITLLLQMLHLVCLRWASQPDSGALLPEPCSMYSL